MLNRRRRCHQRFIGNRSRGLLDGGSMLDGLGVLMERGCFEGRSFRESLVRAPRFQTSGASSTREEIRISLGAAGSMRWEAEPSSGSNSISSSTISWVSGPHRRCSGSSRLLSSDGSSLGYVVRRRRSAGSSRQRAARAVQGESGLRFGRGRRSGAEPGVFPCFAGSAASRPESRRS